MSDFSHRVARGTRLLLRAKTDAGRNRALHFMVNSRSIPPSEAVVDREGAGRPPGDRPGRGHRPGFR